MPPDLISSLQIQLLNARPGWSAQSKMAPPIRKPNAAIPADVRHGAVSILLFKKNQQVHTLLMKRTEDGNTHSGQISFPGGRYDEADYSLTYTALRECEEEIGIAMGYVHLLGAMTPLYIPPSNFLVTPILCFLPSLPSLKLSTLEVDYVFDIGLDTLFSAENKKEKIVWRSDDSSQEMKTPTYSLDENKIIWGATAMMLSELEELYSAVKENR